MDYKNLLEKVEQYARNAFDQTPISDLAYHNQHHTESVAGHAVEMAAYYKLNERDHFVVVASAWLHDLGYSTDRVGHEEKGAAAAETLLQSLGLPQNDIDAVKNCILATKMPQDPHNLLEEIVCDADLFHFGTHSFPDNNKLMRKECEEVKHIKINKDDWRMKTINLLEAHHFHTDYARQLLDTTKQKKSGRVERKIRLEIAKFTQTKRKSCYFESPFR